MSACDDRLGGSRHADGHRGADELHTDRERSERLAVDVEVLEAARLAPQLAGAEAIGAEDEPAGVHGGSHTSSTSTGTLEGTTDCSAACTSSTIISAIGQAALVIVICTFTPASEISMP